MAKDLLGYVHHVRGTTITIKTMQRVRSGGKERVEYSHVALPVKRDAEKQPDRDIVDKAVDLLGDYVVVSVKGGFIAELRKATVEEAKKMRDLSVDEPKKTASTQSGANQSH